MPKKASVKKKQRKAFSTRTLYIIALALLALACFTCVSLISYDPADPSPNHAVDSYITNWAGKPGAYYSDPLLQFIGLAGYMLIVIPTILAVRIIKWQALTSIVRKFCALIATLIGVAVIGAYIDAPMSWPFASMGGIIGDMIRDKLHASMTAIGLIVSALIVTCLGIIGAIGLTVAEMKQLAVSAGRGISFVAGAIYRVKLLFGWLRHKRRMRQVRNTETNVTAAKEEEPMVELPKQVPPKPKAVLEKPKLTQASLPLIDTTIQLPSLTLLATPKSKSKMGKLNESALAQNARLLEKVLQDFGVQGVVTKVRPGPVVTLYELEPAAGTKSSRVVGLADDIARSMSAISARIAVIPGRNAIGIELPNADRETVYLRELLESDDFLSKKVSLPLALGKDIGGDCVIADLAKMPHLLVAGTTGSGKSVAINSMIISLLYRLAPEECRFIMIDPKMLELSIYDGIPHLLAPVVTEPTKAVTALKWVVREMEQRYRSMSSVNVRNISGYNKRMEEAIENGEVFERQVQTGFDPETGKPIMETVALEMKKLPFIVVVVDEMADLMLVAGKEIEGAIQRLAQMARAAGIHIIMATQRPSVDVITGVIKANFPTRISFQVTSKIDSRTILGEMGAEQLLGMGDMLYMAGGSKTTRVHGPFVDDKEVDKVVKFLKNQGEPNYIESVTVEDEAAGDIIGMPSAGGLDDKDASLYDQAVAIVLRDKRASTSYVQRQLKIGYNRAADLIDKMEEEGVISAPNSKGRREVLVAENA